MACSSVAGFQSLSDKGALITGLEKSMKAATDPAKEMCLTPAMTAWRTMLSAPSLVI